MKRREHFQPVDGHVLPAELHTFRPSDWSGSTAVQRMESAEFAAGSHGTSVETATALMDRVHRRRQWNKARTAWCAERGMTDEQGRIDWHRFRPLLRSSA